MTCARGLSARSDNASRLSTASALKAAVEKLRDQRDVAVALCDLFSLGTGSH